MGKRKKVWDIFVIHVLENRGDYGVMNQISMNKDPVTQNGRLEFMDVAKGIAILAIIIGHLPNRPVFLTNFCFSFHVPIFFIISGYFFKKAPWKKLLCSKSKHLLGPYILTCLGVILISTFLLVYSSSSINAILRNIVNWVWSAFYGSGNSYNNPYWIKHIGAIWFLLALFFSYIILNLCLQSSKPEIYLIFLAWAGWYTSKFIWLPFSVQAGMTSAVFMYIGYTMRQTGKLEKLLNNQLMVAGLFVIWIFYLWCGGGRVWLVKNHFEWGILEIFFTFCSSMCVLKISLFITKNTNILKQMLEFLGKNTLYILCFHLIELNTFNWGVLYNLLQKKGLHLLGVLSILTFLKLIWAVMGTLFIIKLIEWNKKRNPHNNKNLLNSDINMVPSNKLYSRIEWIDLIRGISILLMVYAHLAIDKRVRTIIFSFHMPIFFVLSGYLFKYKKFNVFIKSKVHSLIVPYLLTSLFSIIISMWKVGFYNKFHLTNVLNMGFERAVATLLGISFSSTIFKNVFSVGPIWFILALFWSNIIFWIINKITKKEYIRFIGIFVISCVGVYVGKKIAFLPHSFDVSLASVGFIYSGFLLKRYDLLEKISKPVPIVLLITIWLFGIWFGGIELATRNYPLGIISILASISGSIVIMCIFRQCATSQHLVYKALQTLGKYSLIVLCIHCLEMQYCKWSNVLNGVDLQIQFLIKIILILSIMILWFALKETLNSQIKNKQVLNEYVKVFL